MIDTIEELLKLYPPPTHLRLDNGQRSAGVDHWKWLQHRLNPTGITLGKPIRGIVQQLVHG